MRRRGESGLWRGWRGGKWGRECGGDWGGARRWWGEVVAARLQDALRAMRGRKGSDAHAADFEESEEEGRAALGGARAHIDALEAHRALGVDREAVGLDKLHVRVATRRRPAMASSVGQSMAIDGAHLHVVVAERVQLSTRVRDELGLALDAELD